MCGKAGGQSRDRTEGVYGVKTEERKERIFDFVGRERCIVTCGVRAWEGEMWYNVLYCHVRCA